MKQDLMKKTEEIKKLHDDIIHIYSFHEYTMSTKEIHSELLTSYKYTHNVKTTNNHLKRLRDGAVEGVSLVMHTRTKHIMKDLRDINQKELMEENKKTALEHQKKLESKNVMFAEQQTYMRLAMESIKELDTLSARHHQDIEQRLGLCNIESPYFIDNEDMESVNMSDADILYLKDAIREDTIVEFKYDGKSRKDWYIVEPYKLIIFDGLWYLFGKDINDKSTPYKTWRLIYINTVDKDGSIKHKMKDEHTEAILKNVDDANFVVDTTQKIPTVKKNITVKLKVDAQIIKQFDHEAHIPGDASEPVVQDDGSLIMTTKVNTVTDIDAEIKSWIPYIKVLEPKEYKQKFREELNSYLKDLDNEY